MPARILHALLALVWLLQIAQASAQPMEPLELKWSAPVGCPDGAAVKARVLELAGFPGSTALPLRVEGTIERKHDGQFHLRLQVRVDEQEGVRDIDGRACQDLAGAAAVALALLLRSSEPLTGDDLAGKTDDHGLARDEQSRGAEGKASPPTDPPMPPVAHAEEAKVLPARRWRGLLQLPSVAAGFGPLRKPSFGLAMSVGTALSQWRILADVEAWLPQEATVASGPERYAARIRRLSFGLRACRALTGPRFQVAPCVSISGERLWARGRGPNIVSSEATATWAAAGIGVQTALSVKRWLQVVAGIDVRFQMSRPRIAIEGVGTVEKLLPVAGMVRLGAEWIL